MVCVLLAGWFAFFGFSQASVIDSFQHHLVRMENGAMVPADLEAVTKADYIVLYYSAHWCGPCRHFTPKLVEFYNALKPKETSFEVIFISNDRSSAEMQNYMKEVGMPWPAIDFNHLPSHPEVQKYAGPGIPCLVVVDRSGKVLFDSYDRKTSTYRGPYVPLQELDALLKKGKEQPVAQVAGSSAASPAPASDEASSGQEDFKFILILVGGAVIFYGIFNTIISRMNSSR